MNKQEINKRNIKDSIKPFGFSPFYWIVLFSTLLVLLVYFTKNQTAATREISWKRFKQEMLLTQDVDKIVIRNKEIVEVFIKKEKLKSDKYILVSKGMFGSQNTGPHYFFSIGSLELFEQNMEETQGVFPESERVEIYYANTGKSWWTSLIYWVLPLLLFIFIAINWLNRLTARSSGIGGTFLDFGKSNPQVFEKGKSAPITFKDVAGYEEAKLEIMEIVAFLKQPSNFTKLGAKIPKGVLLVGAPGTGKTLMAKAVAGEAGVPFFSLSGSEFIEMFVGVGASRVRDLFNQAKQKAPSIVFIDEIDTIGRVRGKVLSIQANDERESTLNQLLAEMDGFGPNTGVIVLAATNRADILDPALLRSGRFDRHIHLDLPNKKERLDIFQVHLKPLKKDSTVDSENLAAQTPGFSGADIANICNEAALIAARKKREAIGKQDFFDAIDRLISGIEKKSKFISPEERRIIAYHEAGHAIISWKLINVDPLQKISIIPRGKSLGGAWYLPEERQIITRSQFFDQLCAALGGRISEKIVFGDVSSGALDDLEKVTKQSYMMVSQLGLSEKMGNISFYDSTGIYENSFLKPFSEETAKLIDSEVRSLISEAETKTFQILTENRAKLDELVELLIEKEVLYKEDIQKILGNREEPIGEVN